MAKVGEYGKDPPGVTAKSTETSELLYVAPFAGELIAILGGAKWKFASTKLTTLRPAVEVSSKQNKAAIAPAMNIFFFIGIL
jgi:hypothetical protein